MVVFMSSFFPRILGELIGLHKFFYFMHFPLVLIVFFLSFHKSEREHRIFYFGLIALMISIVLSAVINQAGIINIILDMILLSEPFLFFAAIVNSRWEKESIILFKRLLFLSVLFHIALAYYQWAVLGYAGDDVEGVFYKMGAGAHLAGAIALSAAVYFCSAFDMPLLHRLAVFISFFIVVIISDSKQVIAVFLVAYSLIFLVNKMTFKFFVKSIISLLCCIIGVVIIGKTIYPVLFSWVIPDTLFLGLSQKFSVVSIIIAQYDSMLNWFFGLGPGHTIGRLGWLLPDYKNFLEPLGITSTNITNQILYANESSWVSNPKTGSSIFSLMFSWAGIWGDLGILGVSAYVSQLIIILKYFCFTVRDRFWVITIFVFGFTFSWLEEPGYMLFIAAIMGSSWQEAKSNEEVIEEKGC